MNNDEKILTILAEMQVEQRKTNERLDSMEALQTEMQTDLREVKADLDKVKADLNDVKADLANVKADLNEVKEEGQITRNIVTRMENDHGTKLGVIFDGLDLHKDMIEASKEEVMEKVANVDVKCDFIAGTVKQHSKQLLDIDAKVTRHEEVLSRRA